MQFIINADDFGISHTVNVAIENAIKHNHITSSTIIANGPAVDEAIKIAKKYPNISFGIHLNIIQFSPLSSRDTFNKYNLLDKNGEFIEGKIFQTKLSKELLSAIKNEFESQINFLISNGINISHIDSHQHTHTIWDLRNILIEIIKKYNIIRVRRPMIISRKMVNNEKCSLNITFGKDEIIKRKHNVLIRGIQYYRGVVKKLLWIYQIKKHASITNFFVDYRIAVNSSQEIKKWIKKGSIEIMCHPGHIAYEQENILIYERAIDKLYNYKSISYLDLKHL